MTRAYDKYVVFAELCNNHTSILYGPTAYNSSINQYWVILVGLFAGLSGHRPVDLNSHCLQIAAEINGSTHFPRTEETQNILMVNHSQADLGKRQIPLEIDSCGCYLATNS